jgi:hypothetical protein
LELEVSASRAAKSWLSCLVLFACVGEELFVVVAAAVVVVVEFAD